MVKLTAADVDRLISQKMDSGLSVSTVQRIRFVLAQAIDQGISWPGDVAVYGPIASQLTASGFCVIELANDEYRADGVGGCGSLGILLSQPGPQQNTGATSGSPRRPLPTGGAAARPEGSTRSCRGSGDRKPVRDPSNTGF